MINIIALLLILSFGSDAQFISNGDFEEQLSSGWTESTQGTNVTITRATNFDPDPDYEVKIEASGSAYGQLYQVVDIVTTDLEFEVDAKLYSWTTGSWAGAAVCIYYLDGNDATLGVTRIYSKTPDCPWANSTVEHLIEAVDTLWHNYSFNINTELTNLTGINPLDIKKLKITLLDSTYNCWGASELAKVFADNVSLSYNGTTPYIALIGKTIDDTGGNSNGRLDPGETVDISAILKNIGGVDFTNVTANIESTDPYINITDYSGVFGAILIDSIKDNSADPFTLSADGSTPQGHNADFILIVYDGSFTDTFDFSITIGTYNYLVWDPDINHSSGPEIHSILSSLNYSGIYSTSLPLLDLDMYQSIFVCVGIYSDNYLIGASSQEAMALESYLNNGGNVYLEGGDVWYYDPQYQGGYDFGPFFGINATADGASDMGPIAGETGTFTSGMSFTYSGENSYMDHLSPTGSGFIVFKDTDNSYNCGIANDAATHNTFGCSFELSGLNNGTGNSTKEALLDSIMVFFGVTSSAVEELPTVNIQHPILRAYPNPFRESIEINMQIPANSISTLEIFDISGRLVKNTMFSSNSSQNITFTWDGRDNRGERVRSGVYIITFESDDYKILKKIIAVE